LYHHEDDKLTNLSGNCEGKELSDEEKKTIENHIKKFWKEMPEWDWEKVVGDSEYLSSEVV